MRTCSVLLTAVVALIGLRATPAAAARLPTLGAADGATATLTAGQVEFRLAGVAATAAARYVGRVLTVQCSTQPRPGLLFTNGKDANTDADSSTARVVREADGVLVVRPDAFGAASSFDVCSLNRPDGESHVLNRRGEVMVTTVTDRPALARAAVSPAGAVWLEELGHASQLYDVLWQAQARAAAYPLPATFATRHPGVVALDSATASPPAGQIGYWGDGAERASLVTLTGAGRRLVVEDQGNGMLRSNIDDFGAAYVPPTTATEIDLSGTGADRDRTAWTGGRPVGAHDGVRAAVGHHQLTVWFDGRAAAAYRRIAGRRVSVTCSDVVPIGLFSTRSAADALHGAIVRVPRHGGIMRARIGGAADVCSITDDGHGIATVTPTPAGRRVAAELGAAALIFSASDVAAAAPGATVYGAASAIAKRIGHGAVALSGPDAPVARGHVGVWTDGAQRMVLAATSSTGRRMVWADDGDGLMRSNVFSSLAATFALVSLV